MPCASAAAGSRASRNRLPPPPAQVTPRVPGGPGRSGPRPPECLAGGPPRPRWDVSAGCQPCFTRVGAVPAGCAVPHFLPRRRGRLRGRLGVPAAAAGAGPQGRAAGTTTPSCPARPHGQSPRLLSPDSGAPDSTRGLPGVPVKVTCGTSPAPGPTCGGGPRRDEPGRSMDTTRLPPECPPDGTVRAPQLVVNRGGVRNSQQPAQAGVGRPPLLAAPQRRRWARTLCLKAFAAPALLGRWRPSWRPLGRLQPAEDVGPSTTAARGRGADRYLGRRWRACGRPRPPGASWRSRGSSRRAPRQRWPPPCRGPSAPGRPAPGPSGRCSSPAAAPGARGAREETPCGGRVEAPHPLGASPPPAVPWPWVCPVPSGPVGSAHLRSAGPAGPHPA